MGYGASSGKIAKPGSTVVMKYKGYLANGKVFDQTKGNRTFSFRLGKVGGSGVGLVVAKC